MNLKRILNDFLSAIQFLTRVPLPSPLYQPDSLSRAVKFFPLVGALIGIAAALLHAVLIRHLARLPAAVLVVLFLVLINGCLHEDGLADAADGFGGGHSREMILLIFRDSRIGSYGAIALCLSLIARVTLISSIPLAHVAQYFIAAHVLCRWTTLPLSHFLPAARESEGQGMRIARLTTRTSLFIGTTITFAFVAYALRRQALAPIFTALLITVLSTRFFKQKIGGITGDCFGATNQLTEVAIYLCGAWTA